MIVAIFAARAGEFSSAEESSPRDIVRDWSPEVIRRPPTLSQAPMQAPRRGPAQAGQTLQQDSNSNFKRGAPLGLRDAAREDVIKPTRLEQIFRLVV